MKHNQTNFKLELHESYLDFLVVKIRKTKNPYPIFVYYYLLSLFAKLLFICIIFISMFYFSCLFICFVFIFVCFVILFVFIIVVIIRKKMIFCKIKLISTHLIKDANTSSHVSES